MLKRYRIVALVMLTLLSFLAHANPDNANHTAFTFDGKPINPACLAMINNSEVDMPFIHEINMNICQHANATDDWTGQGTSYKNKHGSYSYKVIGETTNHIFVIETISNSNGTGMFQNIVFCRLEGKAQPSWNNQKKAFFSDTYTALIYVGMITGGDRFTGSFKKLRVKGNHVIGTKYSEDNTPSNNNHALIPVDFDLTGM